MPASTCRPFKRTSRYGGPIRGAALCVALTACCDLAFAHLPHDTVEELAVSPDFARDQTLFGAFVLDDHRLFGRSTDAGRSWQYLGPEFVVGSVGSIAFSPDFAADGTAFVATDALGVFRTLDRGTTWLPINAGLDVAGGLSVNEIAASPHFAQDRVLLAGTSKGCFRSGDGGETWNQVSTGLAESNITVVRFPQHVRGAMTAYAGRRTIHRSLDGGLTWAPLHAFTHPMATLALAADFETSATLAVGFGRKGGGVDYSTNGGHSWQAGNAGLTDPFVEELTGANDGTFFAVTDTAGAFLTPALGQSWTLVDAGFELLSDQTTVHYTEVVVSPQFNTDGHAWVGAFEGLFSLDDNGALWHQQQIHKQRLNPRLVPSPQFAQDQTLYCGNYGGGLFVHHGGLPAGPSVSTGGGTGALPAVSGSAASLHAASGTLPATMPPPPPASALEWEARSNGMTDPYSSLLVLAPDFATSHTLFNGFLGLFRSHDAGLHWTKLSTPPGLLALRALSLPPDVAGTALMFLGTTAEGTWRSNDGGLSWLALQAGLAPDLKTTAIRCSPNFSSDQTLLLACDQGVFRSSDAGLHWSAATSGLTSPGVRCMELSPGFATDGTVVAGTVGGGVFVSVDFGATFAARNTGLPSGGQLVIESLALSPGFVADSTLFVATQGHGVFRSNDAGASWQTASLGLPPDAPRALVVSPAFTTDRTLFLSNYGRAHVSRNAGASWTPLPGFVRLDEADDALEKSPGWVQVKQPGSDGTGVDVTTGIGAFQELAFKGDSVRWYAVLDASSGMAAVSLDQAPAELVDLYAPTTLTQQPVYERKHLPPGWHTIRIMVTGLKNTASSSVAIKTDGFSCTY